MGQFDHSAATLRIFGDSLEPNEITAVLKCQPSESQRTGEIIRYSSGRERIVKRGNWRLESDRAEPEGLDGQIRWLLSQMSDDLEVWNYLVTSYDVDMFCGLFMQSGNDGVSFSPEVMLMLGQRGILLDLDVYRGDEEEVPNLSLDADTTRLPT